MKTLVIATPATYLHVLAAAQGQADLLIVGEVGQNLRRPICVQKIFSISRSTPEALAALLKGLSKDYDAFLAPANSFGKAFMPRLAALLDVMQVSDVMKVLDNKTYIRPMYAGAVLARMINPEPFQCLTIRTSAFEPVSVEEKPLLVDEIWDLPQDDRITLLEAAQPASGRPDLSSARVVVAGGRALQSTENFSLIEKLAGQLNGAVGASRAAVDAGYAPNECQVGQTGKIVAPDLYIAVGISGAIQHVAGMRESKKIIAINKDPEAPIFQIADYGFVGDLFEVVPQLIEQLGGRGE